MSNYHNQIITGDALAVLQNLPSDLVQCVVTSPPYYGLRDYGTETILRLESDDPACSHIWIHGGRNADGIKVAQCELCNAVKYDRQIGLEDTPAAYISRLVEVFREVRRVLRDDGTLWLNIGDSYANDGKWGGSTGGKHVQALHGEPIGRRRRYSGLKPKDLMMIPARLAIALQEDGWWLRSDIIWAKSNAMPESVTDRPTSAHEHIFLLAKAERYFYDADAIREPYAREYEQGMSVGTSYKIAGYIEKQTGLDRNGSGQNGLAKAIPHELGRNKRNVWTVASQPYPNSHFATFPPKLIESCILAGSSPRACEQCDAPWERVTEPTGHINQREVAHVPNNTPTKIDSTGWAPTRRATDTWQPTCRCPHNTGSGKCIVLDPFLGAGTTALVALQHHRDYLGIELNPEYVTLAKKRIATIQPVLWEVTAS